MKKKLERFKWIFSDVEIGFDSVTTNTDEDLQLSLTVELTTIPAGKTMNKIWVRMGINRLCVKDGFEFHVQHNLFIWMNSTFWIVGGMAYDLTITLAASDGTAVANTDYVGMFITHINIITDSYSPWSFLSHYMWLFVSRGHKEKHRRAECWRIHRS